MCFTPAWNTLLRIWPSADFKGAPAKDLSGVEWHQLLQALPSLIKCFSVAPGSNTAQIRRNAHRGQIPQQTGKKVIFHYNPFSKAVCVLVPARQHQSLRLWMLPVTRDGGWTGPGGKADPGGELRACPARSHSSI